MHLIEQHNARPTQDSRQNLNNSRTKVEYYHVLSYAPYTSWAKHAAHHTQVDFLIDATLDQRAPLNGSSGSSLMMTALCDTNVVIYLKVSSWNFFLFPSFFPFTALGVLKQLPRCNTSLQLDPPQRTDCLERLVIQVPLKRRESIKLNFQNHSPSHCLLHGNVLDRYWTTAATSPLSVAEGSFLAFILVSGCSRLWNNQN